MSPAKLPRNAASHDDITTPRLVLRLLSTKVLDLCLRENLAGAEALLGCVIPPLWLVEQDFMAMRTLQMRRDPDYGPFGPRAMVLVRTPDVTAPTNPHAAPLRDEMLGHIGFHTPPNPEYLAPLVGHGIELGYTVFPQWRRAGFAEEAVRAIIQWAQVRHHVQQFVASIAPSNVASQQLAKKLGFHKVAEQIDEVDGPEDVLLLRAAS